MTKLFARILLGSLVVAIPVAAAADTVTEAEFLSLLTDAHPAVVALGSRVAAAERAARSPYIENPALDFSLESPEGGADQTTWALAWKPPLDGKRGLRKKAGAAQMAAAQSEFIWSKLGLRATARELYADWWRLTESEALLAAHVETVNRLAQRSQRRVDRGEESGLDAGRLRFAAAEMEAALASLRADLARTTSHIRVYAPLLPEGARPQRPALPEPPTDVGVDPHPAVESGRNELEAARLERKLSGRFFEFPELFAGWTRISGDAEQADGPVFGLQWSLPLFDRNQGEKAMAERTRAIAQARLTLTVAETKQRLSAAQNAYGHLRRAALELQETTADATQLIAGATSAFDNNETSVTDLLEALRSILSGRQAAVDLYHEALAAHRQLEMSVGRALTSGGGE